MHTKTVCVYLKGPHRCFHLPPFLFLASLSFIIRRSSLLSHTHAYDTSFWFNRVPNDSRVSIIIGGRLKATSTSLESSNNIQRRRNVKGNQTTLIKTYLAFECQATQKNRFGFMTAVKTYFKTVYLSTPFVKNTMSFYSLI